MIRVLSFTVLLTFVFPLWAVAREVESLRRSLTVRVEVKLGDRSIDSGSGTIVGRSGNTYRVLTAAHVVKNDKFRYVIHTADNKKHDALPGIRRATKGVDLATLDFQTDQSYETARISEKKPSQTENVTVCGFPRPGTAIRSYILQCVPGQVTAWDEKPNQPGYEMIYNVVTRGGMSGGPVFSQENLLAGVHGLADGDCRDDRCDNKTGFNIAIPSNVIRDFASDLGLEIKQASPILPVKTYVPLAPTGIDVCPAGPGRC
jgi:V8-like Glu-specific endopeptidase